MSKIKKILNFIKTWVLPQKIKEFKEDDFPKLYSFKRLCYENILNQFFFFAQAFGSSEVNWWPVFAITYGTDMVWIVWVSAILQSYVNVEVYRYTAATGESIFTGFSRVHPFFSILSLFLLFTIFIVPSWAQSAGIALKILIVGLNGAGSISSWTYICVGSIIYYFLITRFHWRTRRFVCAIMSIIIIILLCPLASIPSTDSWHDVFDGFVKFPTITEEAGVVGFLDIFNGVGLGALANGSISMSFREDKSGMCALIPFRSNPFYKPTLNKIDITGYSYNETQENQKKFNTLLRFFFFFNFIFSVILVIFTALIPIAIGYDLFYGETSQTPITTVGNIQITSEKINELFGSNWQNIYLLFCFLAVFTTQIIITDMYAKIIAEIFYANWKLPQLAPEVGWIYLYAFIVWIMAGLSMIIYQQATGIIEFPPIVNSRTMVSVSMGVLTPILLYINLRFLPISAKPGIDNIIAMILVSLVYGAFIGYKIFGDNWYFFIPNFAVLALCTIICFIYHKLWKFENLKKWLPSIGTFFFPIKPPTIIQHQN
eukprot:TRINITY_DN545_c1_g1_i3.p1 TRINITY_DN545_c1_g1~~TRINITY_DN545_c1_g1_i3.p1  ORF type:complete len:543 (-),score=138.58 TRINITY_DN545_c1_g1_i3:53-1681(-)